MTYNKRKLGDVKAQKKSGATSCCCKSAKKRNPRLHYKVSGLAQLISDKWKNISKAELQMYQAVAAEEKALHQRLISKCHKKKCSGKGVDGGTGTMHEK